MTMKPERRNYDESNFGGLRGFLCLRHGGNCRGRGSAGAVQRPERGGTDPFRGAIETNPPGQRHPHSLPDAPPGRGFSLHPCGNRADGDGDGSPINFLDGVNSSIVNSNIQFDEISERILKNVPKQNQKYVKKQLELLDRNFLDYVCYYNEKYYRNGFCDGVQLTVGCLN